MVPNDAKRRAQPIKSYQIVPNDAKWCLDGTRMFPKLHKMDPNGANSYQMLPNGTEIVPPDNKKTQNRPQCYPNSSHSTQ